jgi:hypothetical protein
LLTPGTSYTLECECGNCNLGFDRTGKVDHFKITFFEKGKDIFLLKDKYSEAITYGTGRGIWKPYMDKPIMQVNVALQFSDDGVPQVYTLWEKLNKLIVFS